MADKTDFQRLNRIYQESLNLLATALKATNEAAHKAEAAREKGDVDQEIADEVFELGDIVKSATTMCPAARRLFNDIAGILLRDEHEEEAASIGQVPADEFNAVVVQGHGGGISTS